MTVLRVPSVELFIWSDATQSQRSVHRIGSFGAVARQKAFWLRTLKGENLGEIRVERSSTSADFPADDLEIAATFAVRAALAIENALAHSRERHNAVGEAA